MSVRRRVREALAQVPWALPFGRLTLETIRICMRYRVTGLASEAGFFALLSLPPLVFGLAGGVGYIAHVLGPDTVTQVTTKVTQYAGRFLTSSSVKDVIVPTLNNVLKGGRSDIVSLGFLLSVWSGSRALNVFIDTISIMYGQSGVRGIVRTRILSLSTYLVSVLIGVIVVPLVLIGPELLFEYLPSRLQFLSALYWPVVTILTTASLTTLFHISTPRRSRWVRDIPGAVLALVIWLLASFVLRFYLSKSVGGNSNSIYGPLAAPIVLLIWLYFLAIAILIGAGLNAATRVLWPATERASNRARLAEWLGAEVRRRRAAPPGRPLTPVPEGALTAPRQAGHGTAGELSPAGPGSSWRQQEPSAGGGGAAVVEPTPQPPLGLAGGPAVAEPTPQPPLGLVGGPAHGLDGRAPDESDRENGGEPEPPSDQLDSPRRNRLLSVRTRSG